ncbi:MAG TPA: LysR family transcriptional regulator [Desulfomonilaceae bacterium]|nr:LysR family transcriptional regulator [Desulfomonilaceae bacterium]
MEIRHLKTFLGVAKALSFNRAAEHLNYAQSSVSAQIQALEEELGVQLFDRLGRRILLTEAGIRLLDYAEKILQLVDETRAELAEGKEPQGSLTVRIPETFGTCYLPAVIKEFHSRFPKVQLRFVTCAYEGLQKDLRKGVTDLAFLLAESIQAADLAAEVLGFESVVLVASSDHPLAAKTEVLTSDLAGETFLFSTADCSYRRTFEQVLDQHGVPRGNTLEFSSVEALKQSVSAGVGITVLPEVAIEADPNRIRLKVLPWSEGKIEVALLMIWYKEKWISPTLKAFMEITRNVMATVTESITSS